MIRFPQITKAITSSIKRVKGFVTNPSTASILERTPKNDVLIKESAISKIFGVNPKSVIKSITSEATRATGKDAAVFSIPNHDNLVLRVEKSALDKIENLSEDIKLIPIKHHENIANKDNLGLPLYSLVDKTSPLYKKEFITPAEALAQKDNIMVLRKVTGKHPASESYKALVEMRGATPGRTNYAKYFNFEQLYKIREKYGREGAQKCMEELKKVGDVTIPKNFFEQGSEEFVFNDAHQLLEDHRNFVNAYLKELKEISEMPQEAYQKAVDTILTDKNFLMDFQHTNNTFVDPKNNQFNFMDFEYDKSNAKYIHKNPIKSFRNILFGKCFAQINKKPLQSPASLIFDEADRNACKQLRGIISEKVNTAAPEKFKF